MANDTGAQWVADPDGGFLRVAPASEAEPTDPLKDPLYGWKPDSDGVGYVRIPDDELPPIPRAGTWCKIFGLQKNPEMNERIVECEDGETKEEGVVEIISENSDRFMIKPVNLAPLPGSEKMGSFHKVVTLKVNGISFKSDKESLKEALCTVAGVDAIAVTIATQAETGVHPNEVTVKGAVEEKDIRDAIAKVDAGRSKYTVV
jgi:hypothetical protein